MGLSLPDVRPGQIWADDDYRMRGRKVKVLEMTTVGGEPAARVQVIANAKGAVLPVDGKPRITTIRVRRFRPGSTGYRLEQDA